MGSRIYVVESEETVALVRAVSPAKALSHVVQETYQVRAASADDVAKYMGMGAVVEDATGNGVEFTQAPMGGEDESENEG